MAFESKIKTMENLQYTFDSLYNKGKQIEKQKIKLKLINRYLNDVYLEHKKLNIKIKYNMKGNDKL